MDKFSIAIISCLIGVFIGHRLAMGRDKRKEFNSATQKVRQYALSQLDRISETSLGRTVNGSDILALRATLGEKSSKKIALAFDKYKKAEDSVLNTEIPSTPINPQKWNEDKIPKYKVALLKLIKAIEPK
jgi:hypothetical protein